MANILKKKTPPPPDPEQLTADKEAQVTVTEVVKDERTGKIAGAISLLTAGFLFVALTSYLFSWQEDQDIVHQFGIKIFSTADVKVNNLLGVLGAYTAHLLIYRGFGLAAYLLCTFFFVLGMNLLFDKVIFKVTRNIKYVVVGLLVLSMAFAFVTIGSEFSWGGAVGEIMRDWFVKWLGKLGTGAILLLAVFTYVIWRFNPRFVLPEWNKKSSDSITVSTTNEIPDLVDDELPVFKEWNESTTEAKLFIHESAEEPLSNNKLKNDGSEVVLVEPDEEELISPLNQFDLQEKDIAEVEELLEPEILVPYTPIAKTPSVDVLQNADLELEIKAVPQAEEPMSSKVAAAVGSLASKYDVTLDLKDYKYPTLDLLETHGSEKIVHDPAELETHKNQ
ncbi:MAG: DNA translocase FtsK 4TM domain-containing protein, partial [Bacteroidetes bacterium]|nr:DNA translocase FtsK 4TM domain-containing protein [Bacteroidota bacterium]